MTSHAPGRRSEERGIALIVTMFLMASLSALAVSLMFLSNTETASTRNYKTMSQARYAGEAGVHAAINYLLSTSYTNTAPALPFTGYDVTKSPVTCTAGCGHNTTSTCDASSVSNAVSTGCVVLSGLSGTSSNYPDATIATAFSTAAQGTLATNASGTTTNAAMGTVTYSAAAILLSMQQLTVFGGAKVTVQTWQIIGDGTVPGPTPATVEVTATIERGPTGLVKEAVFASNPGCGAITMAGNEVTDSYDSSAALGSNGKPVTSNSGGSVGTNGNLDIGGNVTIHGMLETPKTGVGNCTSGSVTAETSSGNATVDSGYVSIPQTRTMTDPVAPSPMPGTTSLQIKSSTTCLDIQVYLSGGALCTGSGGNFTITGNGGTVALPNVSISSGSLTFAGGTSSTVNVNINTISLSGGAVVGETSGTSVVMNVAGQGVSSSGTVLDFTGGSLSTNSYNPAHFEILYAGTANLKMTGNAGSSALVYAPEAQFTMSGTTDFYGAIISNKFTDTGGATVHYDRSLGSEFPTVSNYALTAFTWKKY
ncbi:MAG TPA: pilus assembly PilX N-terminal domain-containing protein [Vicinamibacterales bacterium]|jgi:Tfp pilus assembly protein PilX|nr:pilus assembly PilX N-terminal domain-containing protein [Vicinamibacterales bacterium]